MKSSRGERIYLYQMFYMQYSRLEFSKIEDRPFGIAGLEKRLLEGFGARGGYGVLDDGKGLLHRSLLWHRPPDGKLERIRFPTQKNIFVPTWSWMAYSGGIDYLDLTFNGFDWEMSELKSPWSSQSSRSITLYVTVRHFDTSKVGRNSYTFYMDIPEEGSAETTQLRCVVLARPKAGSASRDTRCYVLIVAPHGTEDTAVFRRVGVGHMPEVCISQSAAAEVVVL